MSSLTKLRFGVLGMGRMGKRHAYNAAFENTEGVLVAVADPKSEPRQWAKESLPADVQILDSAEALLEVSNIDAILIATETSEHVRLSLLAISKGKHVLVEKPISVDLLSSLPLLEAAKAHPELKIMVGFSRRFDASYREAFQKLDKIGPVSFVRTASHDQWDSSGFFVAYSGASGGIWVDMAIHDIDIARWFLGANQSIPLKIKRVTGSGLNARHPELADLGDADNGFGLLEFEGDKSAFFHVSRTAMHGYDAPTEIFGQEGKFAINLNPRMSRINIADTHGVRSEAHKNYYDRFQGGFRSEIREFTDCVLRDKPVPVSVDDAYEAAKIAVACTMSYRSKRPVVFDEVTGEPKLEF